MGEALHAGYLGRFTVKLDPRFAIEQHVATYGAWEPETLDVIAAFVAAGDHCADVGANAGFHTLAMAKQSGPAGRVLAFEPNGLTYGRLTDNVNMNPGLRDLVRCEKMGLAERDRVMHVYQDGAHNTGNAYLAATAAPLLSDVPPDSYELCLVTTLDGYLAGARLDFMKIDVEGMEHAVLAGAARTLAAWHPTVWYETHLACFDHDGIRRAETLLRAAGYGVFRVGTDGRLEPTSYPDYAVNTLAVHPSRLAVTPA
jgi:FkbM family methyltransferase